MDHDRDAMYDDEIVAAQDALEAAAGQLVKAIDHIYSARIDAEKLDTTPARVTLIVLEGLSLQVDQAHRTVRMVQERLATERRQRRWEVIA